MRTRIARVVLLGQFLLVLAVAVLGHASSDPSPLPSSSSSNCRSTFPNKPKHFPKRKETWTSMLSIDPTEILSTLLREGLFIPEDAAQDLQVLSQLCHVDKAQLNLVERHLILHNFSIPNALLIRNVYIEWDSYRQPCLDVWIDGIDILVEFTNLMLSRNNWNELNDAGFLSGALESRLMSEGGFLSFLRFEGMDVSGPINLYLSSRPLKEELGRFSIDIPTTREINEMIQQLSDKNKEGKLRRGCSANELATVLRSYFDKKIRAFLADSIYAIANNPGAAIQGANELLDKLGGPILSYAGRAGRKTGESLEEIIVEKLGEMGLSSPRDKFNEMKQKAMYTFNKANEEAYRKYEFDPSSEDDDSSEETAPAATNKLAIELENQPPPPTGP